MSKFDPMDIEPLELPMAHENEILLTARNTKSMARSMRGRATSISLLNQLTMIILAFMMGLALSKVYEVFRATRMPDEYARVDSFEPATTYKPLFWWTEYSDANDTAVDAMWEAINPDHGAIAIDREWAKNQHWPESLRWPADSSKNVYFLEGYHLLHCLTIIRKSFWEAVRNRPTDYSEYTYDPSHAGHCLDALRQHIICDANPTPLYSFMETTVGDKQPRKCRDWNALRDFATANSACFKASHHNANMTQSEATVIRNMFTHCPSTSDDGVKVDAERRGNWD